MKVTLRCLPELEAILPKPVRANQGLPDWLRQMPISTFSEDWNNDVRTVKKCPPFVDAMSSGFLVPLPCDIRVDGGCFEWNWDQLPITLAPHTGRSPINFHVSDQAVGSPLFENDSLIIKFMNFWTIELEPGYSLFVTHPVNRFDLPFRSITGLVDADIYKDNYTHFPAVWIDRGFSGVLAKGTPVAQCIPILRGRLDITFDQLNGDAVARLTETQRELGRNPGTYRRRYRASKP